MLNSANERKFLIEIEEIRLPIIVLTPVPRIWRVFSAGDEDALGQRALGDGLDGIRNGPLQLFGLDQA